VQFTLLLRFLLPVMPVQVFLLQDQILHLVIPQADQRLITIPADQIPAVIATEVIILLAIITILIPIIQGLLLLAQIMALTGAMEVHTILHIQAEVPQLAEALIIAVAALRMLVMAEALLTLQGAAEVVLILPVAEVDIALAAEEEDNPNNNKYTQQ
jgi:hypothetical protein